MDARSSLTSTLCIACATLLCGTTTSCDRQRDVVAQLSVAGGGGPDQPVRGEICGNGRDDDADGGIDEGCLCTVGASQTCDMTAARATCTEGIQRCAIAGEALGWGECACVVATPCSDASQCASGACGASGTCVAPTCTDGKKNGSETDVDCGGGRCAPCDTGAVCAIGDDCATASCVGDRCVDEVPVAQPNTSAMCLSDGIETTFANINFCYNAYNDGYRAAQARYQLLARQVLATDSHFAGAPLFVYSTPAYDPMLKGIDAVVQPVVGYTSWVCEAPEGERPHYDCVQPLWCGTGPDWRHVHECVLKKLWSDSTLFTKDPWHLPSCRQAGAFWGGEDAGAQLLKYFAAAPKFADVCPDWEGRSSPAR